jgi:nucleotide-binding universal stress UspA family protein
LTLIRERSVESTVKEEIPMNPSLILYPLSFTPSGRSAFAQALAFARWYDADVHLLRVRGRRTASTSVATPLAEARVEPRLTQFVESVDPSEARISVVELAGDPVTAVSDYANRTAADLIVVAKHGRPYGTYWRPGAYAADLARTASCLTLAVPETQSAGPQANVPFVKILYATDFSSASAAAMDQALMLAQQSAGRITLLHVLGGHPNASVYSQARAMQLTDDYETRVAKTSRELRRLVPADAYNWCEVDTTVVSGVPHRAILATAGESEPDLIVMGLPDRGANDRVVMGSTTTPVLRRANYPVLLVPASRGEQRAMADERSSGLVDEYSAFVIRPDTPGASTRIAEGAGA